MEERYPYIRFVIGATQLVAGAVALIFFLGGTTAACERGGFGGFVSFIVTLIVSSVGYVAAMVWVESLRVFLDIEENTRQLVSRESGTATKPETRPPFTSPPGGGAPAA